MSDYFASADSYDRFMGRFSNPLARAFLDLVDPRPGSSALDVGCGPGALTRCLIDQLGAGRVTAVDPSAQFVQAAHSRFPEIDTRIAAAENLPFADSTFDSTWAQLVIHFVSDPVVGVVEMVRVTRPGGFVAANVWDFWGRRGPLGVFERACLDVDPEAPTERALPGSREGDLERIFAGAGVDDVRSGELTVRVDFSTFEDWWEPFTLGVGPAGAYLASLDPSQRVLVRDRARELLPDVPFAVQATAWTAVGHRPV